VVNQTTQRAKLKKITAAAGLTVAGALALGVIANKYRRKQAVSPSTALSQVNTKTLTPATVTGRRKLLKGRANTTPLLPYRSSRPSNKQIRSLDSYVTGSADLNKALREGRIADVDLDQVKAIDAWMANSTPQQGRFWRGISSERSYEQLKAMRVGDVFTDTGYGSFTSDVFETRRFADATSRAGDQPFILKVKGSLYPLPYDHMANYNDRKAVKYRGRLEYRNNTKEMMEHEKEALSPRNSQFKITKIVPDVSLNPQAPGRRLQLYTIIEVDLIPQEVTKTKRAVRGSSVSPLGLRRRRIQNNPLLQPPSQDYDWDD
jgi:hypothetical protein